MADQTQTNLSFNQILFTKNKHNISKNHSQTLRVAGRLSQIGVVSVESITKDETGALCCFFDVSPPCDCEGSNIFVGGSNGPLPKHILIFIINKT